MITILEDEEIELRTLNENIINTYDIYVKETNECAGYVKYRGYNYDNFLGDMGAIIYPKYRGHNYTYKAIILISQLLNENGIDKYWLTCNKDNIPSKTTIEKLTDSLPEEIKENVLRYECQTLEKTKTSKK